MVCSLVLKLEVIHQHARLLVLLYLAGEVVDRVVEQLVAVEHLDVFRDSAQRVLQFTRLQTCNLSVVIQYRLQLQKRWQNWSVLPVYLPIAIWHFLYSIFADIGLIWKLLEQLVRILDLVIELDSL